MLSGLSVGTSIKRPDRTDICFKKVNQSCSYAQIGAQTIEIQSVDIFATVSQNIMLKGYTRHSITIKRPCSLPAHRDHLSIIFSHALPSGTITGTLRCSAFVIVATP